MSTKKGRFIVVEGLAYSGKTTLVQRLSDHVQDMGMRTLVTSTPGGTEFATSIRHLMQSDFIGDVDDTCVSLLLASARRDAVTKQINPTLKEGINVICDGFSLTAIGNNPSSMMGPQVSSIGNSNLIPDLVILLDVNYATATARHKEHQHHNACYLDKINMHHFNHRRSIVMVAANNHNHAMLCSIDSSKLSPDEVAKIAIKAVDDLLKY